MPLPSELVDQILNPSDISWHIFLSFFLHAFCASVCMQCIIYTMMKKNTNRRERKSWLWGYKQYVSDQYVLMKTEWCDETPKEGNIVLFFSLSLYAITQRDRKNSITISKKIVHFSYRFTFLLHKMSYTNTSIPSKYISHAKGTEIK